MCGNKFAQAVLDNGRRAFPDLDQRQFASPDEPVDGRRDTSRILAAAFTRCRFVASLISRSSGQRA
jgi:hypothetical protein